MIDAKAFMLLKSLNEEEFRRLHKFLRSPFYNYTKALIALFEYLRKYYPSFDSPKLSKEKVWDKIYPEEPFHHRKFWRLTNNLTQLVEKFIVQLELEKEPKKERSILIQALNRRNAYLLFEKETLKMLEKDDFLYALPKEKPLEKYLLLKDYFFHPSTPKWKVDIEQQNEIMECLDLFFVSNKLRLASEFIGRESILKEKHAIHFLQLVVDEVERKYPKFKVYNKIIALQKSQLEEDYWKARKQYLKDLEDLGVEDRLTVLNQLFNYAIWQVNNGNNKFRQEHFELYKMALKSEILIQNEQISDLAFTNIVSYGASFKEFDWTSQFIEKYEIYLEKGQKEDALKLSWGYFFFFKKDFSEVLETLSPHSFKKVIHAQRGKSLLLRSFFELYLQDPTYYELFLSFSLSFEKFLRRDSIQSQRKVKNYLNLISALRKIAKYRFNGKWNQNVRIGMIENIQSVKMVLKPWLLDKLEELGK